MEYDYEVCLKCNDIYLDEHIRPLCEKCVTQKNILLA